MRIHRAISCLTALATIAATQSTWAADNPYMGDPVEQTVASNGALMNARLASERVNERAPEIVALRSRVWVLQNFSIVNCTIVEAPGGLVVFDTGTNLAQGETFLEEIRKLSAKPIIAIIYSHSHYTRGAAALLRARGETPVAVIGHPALESNFAQRSLTLEPAITRRVNMQFGAFLPRHGEDAGIRPPSPKSVDPALLINGHVEVNRPVADSETVDLGGMEFQFFHAQGDTDDSLTVWIPSLSTVLTNVTSQQFFALYTLRGERFREPQAVIDSYDRLRELAPEYYAPTHGVPLSGQDRILERMTAHRDAYSYTFNQAIRAINKGWGPDELVERIDPPAWFSEEPSLYEGYSEFDFALRGIYRGLIGWYGEDAAQMHPPSPSRIGAAVVEGFGGIDALLDKARVALDRREFALAASLADYAVDSPNANDAARQVKAEALRHMAQVAVSSQAYNFLLTQALELEDRINTRQVATSEVGSVTFDSVKDSPTRSLVEVLESRIDPDRSTNTTRTLLLTLTDAEADDVSDRYAIAVRRGVAEIHEPAGGEALALRTDRRTWFEIIGGARSFDEAIANQDAKVLKGTPEEITSFLSMFDKL